MMPQARPLRRVLHVIDSLDLGGAQTVLLNLAATLPAHGWQMEVATMHGRGMFTRPLQELGVQVHMLSPAKWWPAYLWRLPRLLRERPFAILHFHLFGSNWIGKPLAAIFSPALRFNHDHCNDRFRSARLISLWLDALTNCLSDQVLAVSQSTRDFLLQHESLPPERVHLLYNSVDCTLFQPPPCPGEKAAARRRLGLPEDAILIGGIGRLVPQKNFSLWLDIAAALHRRHPAWRFFVAGDGPLREDLRKQGEDLGLGDCLFWGGLVQDRVALLHALDIFLLTSDFEGLPMTILEAMATACPIVASHVDGMAEILEQGNDAFLCPPGDARAFALAVEKLLTTAGLPSQLGAAARHKAETRFSSAIQVARLVELYEKTLAHSVSHG